ncbi:regulation of nuclear pre-mRNA domain-containing protein 2-like [Stegodyphus dumicola]|uniref:regulation of nuclear pre-mRNA domain-containing protein 2-like n=1 Tax=Stegodyphus dumicola TaxID=202533 RepID=UPI0015AB4A24|nr:regulation of nuclear pre-mRNA domain-containing protein 2-like [Stegodyphus dumicola]
METATKLSTINLSKLNATNAEIVQQLKDRIHGQQFKREFDESTRCLEELIKSMNAEIKEKTALILLLEQSEIYYDTQRGEAKIVANAYKNFGARVKTLQKKLEELTATFPSPIPSPCPDAPSPTTSDQELELNLPNDKDKSIQKEVENLENAPSPVGSPEGLNLSPEPKEETKVPVTTVQSVGNPIPTLSNFFSHEQTGMTSWLDAFSNKKTPVVEKEEIKNDPSSLDSRLSNLLQNIPNLPSSLQTSLFGSTSSGNNTPLQDTNSPVINKKEKLPDTFSSAEGTTPIKDEYSGQNTPLQDEDTHSSHAFFTKLASSNKTHSPKDILKGLTSLIQSASGDKTDENHKKEKYAFNSTEAYDQEGGMSSFIKKIIPSISQTSHLTSSPSTYFNSPQPPSSRTVPVVTTTNVNSYQTSTFHDVPTYTSKSEPSREGLSYIPSLVPSTPLDNFSFVPDAFPDTEYNPELENFDTNMDVELPINDSDLDIPSPEIEPLSPVPASSESDVPRSISGRRLSTLITVVTKDSPDDSLPVSSMYSSDDMYKSDKENVTEESSAWIDNSSCVEKSIVPPLPEATLGKVSPNEEFFIGKTEPTIPPFYATIPPPPVIDHNAPNGQSMEFLTPNNTTVESPLSRIETVQSHREDLSNGRWFNNNWTQNERRNLVPPPPPPPPPPFNCGLQDTRFYGNKRFPPPPNFHPRNSNWSPRNRPDNSFHHPYGPPPNKRFPFRGRGWGRQRHQYN